MKSLSAHPDEELANGRDTKGPILFGSGNDLDGTSRWNVVVSLRRWENISCFRHWLLMGTSRFLSWNHGTCSPCFMSHAFDGQPMGPHRSSPVLLSWLEYICGWKFHPYICIFPSPLLLNVPQILRTGVHLQFQKISDWPIWLLIDPLLENNFKIKLPFVGFAP